MNCNITCPHCHKQFSVPDWVVGKRVKCNGCGQAFEAPTPPAEQDQVPDLAALEELEPAAYVPPPIGAPPRQRPSAVPAFSSGSSVDTGPLIAPPPIGRTRRGRTTSPMDDLIHDKLPLALILIGYVLPTLVGLVLIIHFDLGGMFLLQYVLTILAFLGITIPLTVVGLRIAAHVMNFELAESPGFRIVSASAAYVIVIFLYALIHPPAETAHSLTELAIKDTVWLVEGMALGLFATLWLTKRLFFLFWGEAIATWLIATVAWIVGNVASFALVAMVLWLVAMMFSGTSKPAHGSQTAAAPAPHDESKETASLNNLQQIYAYLNQYYKANGKYPDALEALVASQGMPGEVLHSPFGAGTNTDYAYFPYPVAGKVAANDWILAYDQAEYPIEDGAMILRGSGEIKFLEPNILQYAQSVGKKSADEENERLKAEQAAATPPPPPIAPPPPTTQDSAKPIDKPIEPIDEEPTLPEHAWHAEADPPAEQPRISPRLRHVFQAFGTFFFPPQPSNFMLLSRHDAANNTDKGPDELWDLKTMVKASQFASIPVSGGAVLSADGKYFAIRSLGGQDLATEYQVYSTQTGKLTQTLGGPPMVAKRMPTPIAFAGDDQLVTLDDRFDVWGIKNRKALWHFGEPAQIDASTLIAISPGGKLLATLCGSETLSLYSTQTGKLLGQTPIPDRADRKNQSGNTLRSLVFSPDGRELALLLNGQYIYVWSVADGSMAARFSLGQPIVPPAAKTDGAIDSMVWTPDSQGWLVGGETIVDRLAGVGIYKSPAFVERGAKEIGIRQMIDGGHLLLGFVTEDGTRAALETFAIDGKTIDKNRGTMRLMVGPSTQPQ